MSIFDDTNISLAHGNGGRYMRELIEEIFAKHLKNDELNVTNDAAKIEIPDDCEIMLTTDGFIVQPLEFPGGNIGELAIHGTINDLAVSGAKAKYLTLNAIIEEGLEIKTLDRIIESLGKAAKAAGVKIVAGDTKVAPRGHGGGLYLATTGIGVKQKKHKLGLDRISQGDAILVSGTIGDHGICVMLAREAFELKGDLKSDNANIFPLCEAIYDLEGIKFMRDPTRGGLAMVCNEIAKFSGFDIILNQESIPVRDEVNSVCEILGYDPYYLACEGRVVAIAAIEDAEKILEIWKKLPNGENASIIGQIDKIGGRVSLRTPIGGSRILDELEDDPLPRIC
jgi:hydrogenase expression/formation protein HypE